MDLDSATLLPFLKQFVSLALHNQTIELIDFWVVDCSDLGNCPVLLATEFLSKNITGESDVILQTPVWNSLGI